MRFGPARNAWDRKPPFGYGLDPDWVNATGCIGAWMLNENVGTFVNDFSGKRNHASFVGPANPQTHWTGTQAGSAVVLNGSSQYINLPTSVAAFPKNTATLAILLQRNVATPPTYPNGPGFARCEGSGMAASVYPWLDGLIYCATFRTLTLNRVNSITPSSKVDRTVPHMVTVTTKPGANGWQFYQNGIQIANTTGEATLSIDTAGGIYLGRSDSTPYALEGRILAAWLFDQWHNQDRVINHAVNPWSGVLAPPTRSWFLGAPPFTGPSVNLMLMGVGW